MFSFIALCGAQSRPCTTTQQLLTKNLTSRREISSQLLPRQMTVGGVANCWMKLGVWKDDMYSRATLFVCSKRTEHMGIASCDIRSSDMPWLGLIRVSQPLCRAKLLFLIFLGFTLALLAISCFFPLFKDHLRSLGLPSVPIAFTWIFTLPFARFQTTHAILFSNFSSPVMCRQRSLLPNLFLPFLPLPNSPSIPITSLILALSL